MPVGEPDEFEEMMLFPITDIDNDNNNYMNNGDLDHDDGLDHHITHHHLNNKNNDESGLGLYQTNGFDYKPFKPAETLRQRRRSKLGIGNGQLLNVNVNLKPGDNGEDSSSGSHSSPRLNWMKALKKIRSLKDPWAQFHINDLPTEAAIRHRYNALKKKWVMDKVNVKMENEPFNHGAMRACYRLKKLSSFSHSQNWKHAHNYVAKRYMEDVERDVYFEDVRLQLDAKLWGEEYNRHNPPKKADIFQMYVLEFTERPGRPLFHLEHYIEGEYIKYNSNSGFVEESLRLTPQAFSHFTFERSGHQLIVVDIQGVGDLWTDPQIHTFDGLGYGDGNLGTKGMALFFHSHTCNKICQSLMLTPFDLAPSEVTDLGKFIKLQKNATTVVRGIEEMCVSCSPADRVDLTTFLARNRRHTTSSCSTISAISECSTEYSDDGHNGHHHRLNSLEDNMEESESPVSPHPPRMDEPMSPDSPRSPLAQAPLPPVPISPRKFCRVRFQSSESDDSNTATLTTEEERIKFQEMAMREARPSCVAHEINLHIQSNNKWGDSVLGGIHHDMAKYHEIGRFAIDREPDMNAAVYHEQHSAELGVKEAVLTLAQIYLDLPRDVLVNCTVKNTDENVVTGINYMLKAAEVGDRSAMIYMAKAYETGFGLGKDRTISYKEAVHWYEEAVKRMTDDDCGEFDATMDSPVYQLQAKMAEMYLEGGSGLDKDPSSAGDLYNEAAEGAMGAMKGRLANKYYALSEEAYGQVEEEETGEE